MHREVAPIVADGSVYITGPHSPYCARCSHLPRDPGPTTGPRLKPVRRVSQEDTNRPSEPSAIRLVR